MQGTDHSLESQFSTNQTTTVCLAACFQHHTKLEFNQIMISWGLLQYSVCMQIHSMLASEKMPCNSFRRNLTLSYFSQS